MNLKKICAPGEHDLSLTDWGPDSKKTSGIAHAACDRGTRFCSTFDGAPLAAQKNGDGRLVILCYKVYFGLCLLFSPIGRLNVVHKKPEKAVSGRRNRQTEIVTQYD